MRPCPICATPSRQEGRIGELGITFNGNLTRNRYDLARCATCDLIYISPLPTAGDLETMYVKTEQFSDPLYNDAERVEAVLRYMDDCLGRILALRKQRRDKPPGSSPAGPAMVAPRGWGERLRAWLDRSRRAIAPTPQTMPTAAAGPSTGKAPFSVLEVGAGRAWMCRAAKRRDPAVLTVAQDVSPEVAGACPWVDQYLVGELADPRMSAAAPFDIISMTHVIEHLTDPVALIRRARELLAPGGVIFITAPHRPTDWNEGRGGIEAWRRYSYNHVPAHIQYFSREAMNRLAGNTGCALIYWSDSHEDGQAFEAWLS